jgi:serine phosphatase RsbU (regulator of sigma subunit)
MTILRSAFRVDARNETSARNLLCSVNNSMRVNLDDRSFVTAVCLIIQSDGTMMSYARAGHPKLIKINVNNTVETIESNGIALGFISDSATFAGFIEEIAIPLLPGERYLIYTDGLTEAVNNDKEPYGAKRLTELLSGSTDGITPEAILDTVMGDIKRFSSGAPYHDDLTVIALQVTDDA